MTFKADVHKVYIVSPPNGSRERSIVRLVLARWNVINSEKQSTILLPIDLDTDPAVQSELSLEDYINKEILDECDILIGVFGDSLVDPIRNPESETTKAINRHMSKRKLTMLYYSKNTDLEQVQKVRFVCKVYNDEYNLQRQLYDDVDKQVAKGKFRPTFDSDNLALITNDDELARQIAAYNTLVSKNLLEAIVDEERDDIVWDAMVNKLVKSPAELRDSLEFLANRGAFKHRVFTEGYPALAKCSQEFFGIFLASLNSINKYECLDIYKQNLLEDSDFARRISSSIEKRTY